MPIVDPITDLQYKLCFLEGFDTYDQDEGTFSKLQDKWTSNVGNAGAFGVDTAHGRFGTKGLGLTGKELGFAVSPVSSRGTKDGEPTGWCVVGGAFRCPFLGQKTLFNFLSPGGAQFIFADVNDGQCQLNVFADGAVGITAHFPPAVGWGFGSRVIVASTAPGMVRPGEYNYIEIAILISSTNGGAGNARPADGGAVVRLNGVEILNLADIVTAGTAIDDGVSAIRVGGGGSLSAGPGIQWDDLYCCSYITHNKSEVVAAGFLGDIRVKAYMPNAVGDLSGFTRVGGDAAGNYTAVDEIGPDEDTSYVKTQTLDAIDLYHIANLTADTDLTGVVAGTGLNVRARRDLASQVSVGHLIKTGTTVELLGGYAPGSAYRQRQTISARNPATGLPWTATLLDAVQVGIKKTG